MTGGQVTGKAYYKRGSWNLGHERLTVRETEILSFVMQGDTNKEIANKLEISEQTVKNHVSSILKVTNSANRTQAAMRHYAIIKLETSDYLPYFLASASM